MSHSVLRRAASLLLCASMLTPAFAAAPAAMKQEAAANFGLSDRYSRKERLQDHTRHRRHAHRLDRDLG
jgi:hypothetical protein